MIAAVIFGVLFAGFVVVLYAGGEIDAIETDDDAGS